MKRPEYFNSTASYLGNFNLTAQLQTNDQCESVVTKMLNTTPNMQVSTA